MSAHNAMLQSLKYAAPKWARQFVMGFCCSLRYYLVCGSLSRKNINIEPTLVVAPHPDDETFACGGLIILKRAASVPVRVVILTDGEGVAAGLSETTATVVAARTREALIACQRLGVEANAVRWLHLPDGGVPHPGQDGFDNAADALLAEIKAFEPKEIYCPHIQDIHPDHVAAAHLTHQALRSWNLPCAIFYYPVWAWYHAGWGLRSRLKTDQGSRLDVSAVLPEKRHAMSAYLDAPKSRLGYSFCGSLPAAFVQVFRRKYEAYFQRSAHNKIVPKPVPSNTPSALKALFISPAHAVYGSERSMLALLQARSFQAEVVCPAGGALEGELQQLGVKVHPLQFGKYSVRDNPVWHVMFYRRLREILDRSRPDVLVINLDGNTPLVTLAATRAGIPIIRFCRFEFEPPRRWIERWAWLKAQTIICPSEWVKQQLLAWAPLKFRSRVLSFHDSFVGHAATTQSVDEFRRELRLGRDKTMGYVGRFDRRKNIGIAIRALAEVRKQVSNAKLLIIGDTNALDEINYKRELEDLASDLEVSESVIFTGYRRMQEMPAAFAALDVCVLPSQTESFGMVLMEAWAQNVPTVASDIGACREISQASGGGYLARVGDVDAFASHLISLLTDSETAVAMGRKGRKWVEENCCAATYANRFEEVIYAMRVVGELVTNQC